MAFRRNMAFVALCVACSMDYVVSQTGPSMNAWSTFGDESKKLFEEPDIPGLDASSGGETVDVDTTVTGQSMKGFGAAFSNSASYVIQNSPVRDDILESLFNPDTGIGISYVRLVMGGSDLNAVEPYTYDDIPSGVDFNMEQFSIEKDMEFVIPLLQTVVDRYLDVKIMASPWSPPAWMKTGESLFGGELKQGPQYLSALAEYFVLFIQAYESMGISIDAISVQNEPMFSDGGYPTMYMSSATQKELIRDYLGPAFAQAGITASILILDHNWDLTAYVEDILSDPDAAQYIAGSAWHCYAGDPGSPAGIKQQFPSKDLYFSECSGGEWDTNFASVLGWNIENLFIGQSNIGSRNVLLWNLALDENMGPRVGVTGGCSDCRGVITVNSNGPVENNVEYYAIGHFSKFVRPGANLISVTTGASAFRVTGFQNPDGSVVVAVLNTSWDTSYSVDVVLDGFHYFYDSLPPRSVITLIRP